MMRRRALRMLPAALAALLAAAAVPAETQPAVTRTSRPVRLLRSWEETVKTRDGGEYARRVDVVFDYRKGVAHEYFYSQSGRPLGSRRITQILPAPSREEIAEAFAVVRADEEMQRILTRLSADLEGGFLVEEGRGRPCGPASRCLLVLAVSADHSGLVRRVVVDLARRTIPYRTFDPAHHGGVK